MSSFLQHGSMRNHIIVFCISRIKYLRHGSGFLLAKGGAQGWACLSPPLSISIETVKLNL